MRIVMMGTGSFAEPTFLALAQSRHEVVALVTNPDRPAGKEREMVRPIKKLAVERGIPVFQPESVNSPEGVAGVRSFRPDLLVVAAYGQILSAEVLESAPRGGINVHASLLPKYRGAAPVEWAIYHGETQTGVTIIRMSTKLDAGEMLAQEAVDILPDETAGELEARLAQVGARLAVEVVERLAAGEVRGIVQDPRLVTKAPKLKKEHGLIDWTRPAHLVCCQIRAMQPWPTAYTFLHQEGKPPLRLIVLKARPEALRPRLGGTEGLRPRLGDTEALRPRLPDTEGLRPPLGAPGVVVGVDDEGILVAAGEGWVRPLIVQPAGKRPMTIAEFLRGHPVRVGDRFGPESP
ncbi:MAG: methionyl-tRNA formyltransferase [Gemmatales bacterium]|nr:methionyl-tRNA formyltransferase [Gemmatales bacterium]MDW8388420.1 methionyl-tRNA formyltransferase [Gemmatales bacterium]